MVIYDLVCMNFHAFEGWFKNHGDFVEQVSANLLRCPTCDSESIERKISTLNVVSSVERNHSGVERSHSSQGSDQDDLNKHKASSSIGAAKQAISELMRVVTPEERAEIVRDFVEKNFEDVGNSFTDEVRKMHYGEIEGRGIRGQATAEEIADLEEEGISALLMSSLKVAKRQLN